MVKVANKCCKQGTKNVSVYWLQFLNLDDVGSLFTKRWIGSGENILPLPLRSDVFDRADADNRGTALLK